MATLFKNIQVVFLCILASLNVYADFTYKPVAGDKFQYKISNGGGKFYQASFVYDLKEKQASFYYKFGNDNPQWGTWTEPKTKNSTLINDLRDTNLIKSCNLIFLNQAIFKQIKSGKNFKLVIQKDEFEFKCGTPADYLLPIDGAGINFKILTATSTDNKWIINVLDNPSFPIITALLGDMSWQLQTIVPVPMYPITQNLVGKKMDDKQVYMFRSYIKETCVMVEASYKENFRKVVFNEYFCPTIGTRFTLKNDTIVSLQLVSNNNRSDGYNWQTYKGRVWGIYGMGDKQKAIEKKTGKPKSNTNGRCYYPKNRFYLLFNKNGELETVEYE